MEKRTSFRLVSFILALVLTFCSLPMLAFARQRTGADDAEPLGTSSQISTNANASQMQATQSAGRQLRLLGELTELRESNVKHFLYSDGTVRCAVYEQDVHYLDENGLWQDIDNTLTFVEDENGSSTYTVEQNRNMDVSQNAPIVRFAPAAGGEGYLYKMYLGAYSAFFAPIGASVSQAQVLQTEAEPSDDPAVLSNLSSSVLYQDVWETTDLAYYLRGASVFEHIIVKRARESYAYGFRMQLSGLTPTLTSDGSIVLSDSESEEAVYTIPPSYMYDSAGVSSNAVTYTLAQEDNGVWNLTITADDAWMDAQDRVFPVVIDPPVTISGSSKTVDTYIDSQNPTQNYADQPFAYAGKANYSTDSYETFWKAQRLTSISSDNIIVDAILRLRATPDESTSVVLGAYLVQSNWGTNLCYNDVYGTSPTVSVASTPLDYATMMGNGSCSPVSVEFNVTEAVRGWYEEGNNYGLCIKTVDGYVSDFIYDCVSIATSASGDTAEIPVLTITYKSIVGLESYFSYTTVGTAGGTGYINHTTGQMVHTFASVPSAEAIFSYAPQIYYVQGQGMNGGIGNADKGAGFFFDWDRSISKIKLAGGVQVFCYTDADRTEHYFTATDTPNLYKDEDGLQLELETMYTNGTLSAYHLTDGFTTYVFNSKGELHEIKDESGNALRFVRTETGYKHVSQIILIPNGYDVDEGIVQFELTYDATEGVLTKILCPQTGDALAFEYTSKYDEIDTYFVIYTSLTYKKGNTAVTSLSLDYDTSANLLSITDDVALYRTEFDYAPSGYKHIVVSLTEYARESADATYTEGQKISFAYEQWLTTVQSAGSDDVYGIGADGTSDDLCTCYALDGLGRAVLAYTCNTNKTQIYGVSGATYEADENTPTNGLSQTFTTGLFTQNLLTNGNFENTSGWALMGNITYDNNGTVFDGGKALKLELTNASASASATQQVYLKEGKYNFSGHIQLARGGAESLTVFLDVIDMGGKVIASCIPLRTENLAMATAKPIPLSVTFEIENAGTYGLRIYADATVPAGGQLAYVYADGMVLAESADISLYNYLQNGDFGKQMNHWTVSYGSAQASDIEDVELALQSKWNQNAHAKQTISAGFCTYSKKETYLLSGWAKATDALSREDSVFALQAIIRYKDASGALISETSTHTFSFSPSYDGWQYITGAFTVRDADADDRPIRVASIDILCLYENNYGTAYFDDLALVRGGKSVMTYEYNEDGFLSSAKDGDGIAQTLTYDGDNEKLPTKLDVTGEAGYAFGYGDNDGNEDNNKEDDLLLKSMQIDTDGNGPHDLSTDYTYNAYGQMTGTKVTALGTNGLKTSSAATYSTNASNFGFTLTETDANNATTTYEYTNGMLQKVIFSDGQTGLWYEYDAKGNLISVLPIAGGVVQENSASVTYTYDSRGRLEKLNTQSIEVLFTYDAFGRNTSISVGGRVMASYTYQGNNGKLLSVQYGNGYKCINEYDDLGRVSKISFAYGAGEASVRHEYNYNTEGQLISLVDKATGQTTVYEYDASGQLIRETVFGVTQKNAQTFKQYLLSGRYFCYNDSGKTAETGIFLVADERYYPLNQGEAQDRFYRTVFNYGYKTTTEDGAESVTDGNLVTSIDVYIDGAQTPTYTRTFTYDDLERQTSSSLTNGTLTIATTPWYKGYTVQENGSNVTYATTLASGYMHNVSYAGQSVLKEYAEYYHDSNHRISSIVYYSYDEDGYLNSPIFDTFVYDDLGQLIRENNGRLNRTYVYTYDNAGNLTQKKEYAYTTGSTENATPLDTVTYTYGDDMGWGDLLTAFDEQEITYDAIGNPLEYRGMPMTWSDGRRLATVTSRGIDCTYTYNADGLRVERTLNTVKFRYLYDEGRLARIERESGIYLNYIDFLYDGTTLFGFRYFDPHESYEATFYYLIGYGGNIDGVLDEQGNVVVRYIYDAWGNFTEENYAPTSGVLAALALNPFRYRGYVYDFETGFYYLQSRYYDPETGRFISADSYVSTGTGLLGCNMFAYCDNDPINKYDPSGEFAITLSTLIIGGLIAGGIGAGIGLGTAIYNDVQEDDVWFNGDLTDYAGRMLGGFVAGFGVGICTVLGAGVGAATLGGTTANLFTSTGLTLSLGSALGIGSGVAFSTGMAGYAIRSGISRKEDFKVQNMFIEGGFNAIAGALSVCGGYLGGLAGFHNTVFTKLLSQKGDFWFRLLVENAFTAGLKLTNSFIKPLFMI